MQSQSLVRPEPGLFLGQPLLSATKFKINLNRNYLAKGLLLASQVSILVGPPNTGKSSVVACLAASISMGRAVGETRVKRAAVIYVAAEDPNGIAERAYGFFQTEPTDLAHFYIHGFPVNLADEAEMKAFCAEAKRLRREVEAARLLIVFDTLNLCIGDGDENSARDMSRVIGNAQRLARATRAHVMIVHHTSAADAGRPRGSTAMHGNADTLLVLRRAEGEQGESLVLLTQEKQRSVQKGKPLVFNIAGLEVGEDDDGEIITVPIARPSVSSSSLLPKVKEGRSGSSDGEARAAAMWRVLTELRLKTPGHFYDAKSLGGMAGETFEALRANPDSLRKAVRRALETLTGEGKVEAGKGGFRAVPAGPPPNRPIIDDH